MTEKSDGRSLRGARRGPGAPKGNRNAFRHGEYCSAPELRRAFARARKELSRADYHALTKAYKAGEIDSIEIPEANSSRGNVLPFQRPSITTAAAPTPKQWGRFGDLPARLASYDVQGATTLVHRHEHLIAEIEETLDYVYAMGPGEFARLKNPGGFIVDHFHKGIGIAKGSELVCPVGSCRWAIDIASAELESV